ncbi:ferric reductase-like transmembrane domain-containing protein [Candidatus Pacearchaeota archaeon]|nr:ferric reductase-like transmembrane domain-containing protein [Candidatus Pacearchaeota archaeon]
MRENSKKTGLIYEEKIKEYLKKESDWFVALSIGAILFFIILYYHYLRRGIINPFLPNEISFLFLANKAFAISSIFLIGISFLIGPLAKFFDYFKNKIRYRKEIGVMGFLFALVHAIISLFFLGDNFPKEWFIENQISVIFGVASLAILMLVTCVSNNFSIVKLGYKKWIFIQRLAYLALILAAVHFIILKFSGWKEWINTLNPVYPPGTLIAIIFIIIVLLIRMIVLFIDKREKSQKVNDFSTP